MTDCHCYHLWCHGSNLRWIYMTLVICCPITRSIMQLLLSLSHANTIFNNYWGLAVTVMTSHMMWLVPLLKFVVLFSDQEDRQWSIREFREGRKDVLVATDVASKGLDFPNIQHVINYDMPTDIENYGECALLCPLLHVIMLSFW